MSRSVIAIMPDALSVTLPSLESAERLSGGEAASFITALPFLLLSIWLGVAALLLAKLFGQTIWLHRLPATRLNADLALTSTSVPPHALGWPSCRVVVPVPLWEALNTSERTMLVAHERSHLSRRDPEVTLALLTLQSVLWFNPGMRWLVSGWRQAAEIRADRTVITHHDPRDYAQMFARLLRTPHGLPVPTATPPHTSGAYAMRIDAILNAPSPRPRRVSMLVLSLIGCASVAISADAPPTDYPKLLTNVPPVMPMDCLITEAGEPTALLNEVAETTADGRMLLENGVVNVGWVNVSYDVNHDGSTHNIAVIQSQSACFEPASLKSVSEWQFESGKAMIGMETQLRFVMQFDAGEDYLAALRRLRDNAEGSTPD
ncbi:MAG: M56 family metallopeptidase [Pseudomonadota bacterium]